jgi:hypothetical protein
VFDLDYYQPDWQMTQGVPSFIGMAGRNMVCLGQAPDVGPYSVGLWLCANAFLGSASNNYIQVTNSQYDAILDYAQHVACFKMGGFEFNATDRMRMNLIAAAQTQNQRLDAVAFYRSQLEQPALRSNLQVPRLLNA